MCVCDAEPVALDEVRNEPILINACAAYWGLMQMSSPEFDVFAVFFSLKNNWYDDLPVAAK
jgi:hypothetical protein